jgi:outer membrane murein-binding lipoprotein Lpp
VKHTFLRWLIGSAVLGFVVKSGCAGKAKMVGNPQVLVQLGSTIVKFDEWSEVLPKRRM